MHDIWNPWHGCVKCSEGCQNCYMYFLDRMRGQNGADIYRTKNGFSYPLQRERSGGYKVRSGEMLRVCMTSDFFLEQADPWRAEAWEIMRQRSDVKFSADQTPAEGSGVPAGRMGRRMGEYLFQRDLRKPAAGG